MAEDMTALEFAVAAMFGVYMSKEGQDGKLSKPAFLQLLKEEMPSFAKGGGDIGDEVFEGVDLNSDGSVDFKEFALMVAMFASANYDALQEVMKIMKEKKK